MELNDLKKEFNIPLDEFFPLDTERLPFALRHTLLELAKVMPRIPMESLLLDLLVKIARTEAVYRLRWQSESGVMIPANIYAINFMGSGKGKDRPLSEIDNTVFKDVINHFSEIIEKYKEKIIEENREYAEVNLKGRQRDTYMITHAPGELKFEVGDGTPEGLISDRAEFERANIGGTFIKIAEFADYILSENERKKDFLTTLKEIYEYGDSGVKTIKGERTTKAVKGVPNNALFHSSITGLQTSKGRAKLMDYLNRGLARRSFFCYPDVIKAPIIDRERYKELIVENKRLRIEGYSELNGGIREWANEVFAGLNENNLFTIDEEAGYVSDLYEQYNTDLASSNNSIHESVAGERESRAWKANKLALVLAGWEHPEVPIVNKEDKMNAIYLTEYYGQHFEKLIRNPMILDAEVLFNNFVEKFGKWFSTMDIRRMNICQWDNHSKWLNDVLPDVSGLCTEKGYKLVIETIGTNGRRFKVIEDTKAEGPETDLTKIKMSYSEDLTEKAVIFKPIELPFDDIFKIVSKFGYSSSWFKDNKRKDDNVIPGQNLIILDIDDGWTIKEALEFLNKADYRAKIITTRSHQKEKHGKICDRFRIFLPTKTEMKLDKEQYKEIMMAIHEIFLRKPDEACKNIGRNYFANKGQVFDSIGTQLFDWVKIKLPKIVATQPQKVYNYNIVGDGNTFHDIIGTPEFLRRLEVGVKAKAGSRDNFFFRAAQWLEDDGTLTKAEIINELLQINRGIDIPFSESVIIAKVNRAFN